MMSSVETAEYDITLTTYDSVRRKKTNPAFVRAAATRELPVVQEVKKRKERPAFVPAGPPGSMELLDQALSAPPFWGLRMKDGDTSIDMVWVDGPAHSAGILPMDVIRKINGKPVMTYEEVSLAVRGSKVGEAVVITCDRHDDGPRGVKKATTTFTTTHRTVVPKTANEAFDSFPEIYFDLKTHTFIPKKAAQGADGVTKAR